MVVKRSGALVEATRMPRAAKPELLIVEVVAEFVAEGAQECSERGDLLTHRRPHPHPDQHGFGIVVPEKLGGPVLSHSCVWDCVLFLRRQRDAQRTAASGALFFGRPDAAEERVQRLSVFYSRRRDALAHLSLLFAGGLCNREIAAGNQ